MISSKIIYALLHTLPIPSSFYHFSIRYVFYVMLNRYWRWVSSFTGISSNFMGKTRRDSFSLK